MTTTHMTQRPATGVDRLVNWLLDVDGEIYGDERERLRWYEAISLAASFQWIVIPWALAILVWFAGRETARFLIVLIVLFYLPMPLVQAYLSRRGVRTVPDRRSAKYWTFAVLGALPYPVFALGFIATYYGGISGNDTWLGALVGAVVGGGLGVLALWAGVRQRRRREAAAEDLD